MLHSSSKKRLALAVAASALMGSAFVGGGSATADPKQFDAPFIGVGSDTTQDVLNAFAGFSNGINYVPLQTSLATGFKQISSWDATSGGLTTTCIATKTGGPSFNRPNGSSSGRAAFLSAFSGGTTSASNCGGTTTSASGQIQFARSSSLSGTAGTTLAYVPFARDALSYGAYRANGSPIVDLSTTELNQIFTTPAGVDIVRGPNTTRVIGCGIQPGSGTGTSWQALVTGSSATYQTTVCDGYINPATGLPVGRSQETDGPAVVVRGDIADSITDGAQVVIGFSVGNYVAVVNGRSPGTMPSTVVIGAISNIAGGVNPVVGSAVPFSGNSTYYASTFGRDLYNVFQASVINSAFANDGIKEMFKGAGSQVCLGTATLQLFGFQPVSNCGDSTTLRGA